ncbi:MAG: glutaredoxin family protein [Pseudomonadales bacterium]|jgi:glutaredoxin
MKEIVFYTTQHCGLCEAAMDALLALPEAQGSQLRTVDIALDDDLMAQYGTRIPVIAVGESELQAPFDQKALQKWLQDIA